MQPLNQSERKRAFINFLLFFIVTITFVLTVVFFSIQVPYSQNEQLQNELSKFKNDKENLQDLQAKMAEINDLLGKLDSKEEDPNYLNPVIGGKIEVMFTPNSNLSTDQAALYKSIGNILSALRKSKNDLRELSNNEKGLAELREKNKDLDFQIKQKDIQIADLFRQLSFLSQQNRPLQ